MITAPACAHELDRSGTENPGAVSFLQSLDHATAIARPAITVVLLVTGTFVGSEVMGQTALHLAGHTAGNMAAEAAIAGGITVSGDAVMTATGEGVRQTAVCLFRRLQNSYAESAPLGSPAGSTASFSAACWPIFAAAPTPNAAPPSAPPSPRIIIARRR